ncbi:MAG: hypothetical protein WC760_14000 [Bacteroidia bacterium]|jgi:guanylate kinase
MKKLLVFVGEGGSGKTTLITELTKKHPDKFKKVVTCTSRMPRVSEVDGVDYHFLPTEYFVNNQDLVLVKRTNRGDYYGTRRADLYSNTHYPLLTLRFAGINKLIELAFSDIAIVYISITMELKIARMQQRGDTEEMIRSRLKFDDEDKINVDWSHIPIINLDATETLDKKVRRILELY